MVASIAADSEVKGYELSQYAENIGQFIANFSVAVNGTSDAHAKQVCDLFRGAQKNLYIAAKISLEAAKVGNDWCGTSPQHVLKKVRC